MACLKSFISFRRHSKVWPNLLVIHKWTRTVVYSIVYTTLEYVLCRNLGSLMRVCVKAVSEPSARIFTTLKWSGAAGTSETGLSRVFSILLIISILLNIRRSTCSHLISYSSIRFVSCASWLPEQAVPLCMNYQLNDSVAVLIAFARLQLSVIIIGTSKWCSAIIGTCVEWLQR